MTRPPSKYVGTPPVETDAVMSSPGFYRLRLVEGGAYVPARLWVQETRDDETGELIADVRYFAEIDGRSVDPFSPPGWPWVSINYGEWRLLTDTCAWARQHEPDSPYANPHIPTRLLERNYV